VDQFDSEDETKSRPGVPVDAGRIVQAMRRHWKVLPISVAVGALIGLAVAALMIKPVYTAKSTLLWEPNVDGAPTDRSFLTQVDSIKLASNLKEVKRRLRLRGSADDIKEKINLLFDGQSHLVVVEATDPTAKGATALAKTVVDVFLDYQRSIGRDRGSEHLRRIEADLVSADLQLRTAREAMDAFRREIGVSDYDVELKLALQKVAEFKQQVEMSGSEAETEAVRARIMAAEAQRQPENNVSSATLSNPDALQLSALESQLASDSSHLSPDHPRIALLKGQIEGLREKVRNGRGDMVRGAVSVTQNQQHVSLIAGIAQSKVAREAALERHENSKRLLAEAEQRLAQLSVVQGRAQQLTAAVTAQEAHNNELQALRVRTRDQVRSAAADFRVVTQSTLPDKPNPSSRRAAVIRMPIIALALAIFGIIGYELRGLRVHTAREAGFWANAAVVASSTWPREQTTLGTLIDELSDAAPDLRGTTLVVGARTNEVPLAREIAYWLSHLTASWAERGVVADQPVVGGEPSRSHRPSARGAVAAAGGGGTALVRRTTDALTVAQAWDGPSHGPSLRRASRLADRVLVVVAAGTMSVTEISQLRSRLGRTQGIGLLLVGLNPEYLRLPDRVGEVDRFWEERAA